MRVIVEAAEMIVVPPRDAKRPARFATPPGMRTWRPGLNLKPNFHQIKVSPTPDITSPGRFERQWCKVSRTPDATSI